MKEKPDELLTDSPEEFDWDDAEPMPPWSGLVVLGLAVAAWTLFAGTVIVIIKLYW